MKKTSFLPLVILFGFLVVQAACSGKKEGAGVSGDALTGTTWQFDHATGLTTVALTPATNIQTTTLYLENANQAPFKNQKLLFYDATRFGGIIPVSLRGPVAATGTYTRQGNQLRFIFNFFGYNDTPGKTQDLKIDSGKTAAYLNILRQDDDELVLIQDLQSLSDMEAINQKDPNQRALYAKSTATYFYKRVK